MWHWFVLAALEMCGLCKSIEMKSFIESEKLHRMNYRRKQSQRLSVSCVFVGVAARAHGWGFGKERTGTWEKGGKQELQNQHTGKQWNILVWKLAKWNGGHGKPRRMGRKNTAVNHLKALLPPEAPFPEEWGCRGLAESYDETRDPLFYWWGGREDCRSV